jgi:hypothetical protein
MNSAINGLGEIEYQPRKTWFSTFIVTSQTVELISVKSIKPLIEIKMKNFIS